MNKKAPDPCRCIPPIEQCIEHKATMAVILNKNFAHLVSRQPELRRQFVKEVRRLMARLQELV